MSGAAGKAAGLLAALMLAAAALEGCAGDPARASADGMQPGAATPETAAPAVPAPPQAAPVAIAPPPLLPLARLLDTPKAEAASTVMPVVSDGSVDPQEDAAEPGIEFERGGASWYGSRFQGRRTASGERFDLADRTAAHRTLPFGTLICVRNLANARAVLVRINDRGPASRRRVIDISQAAADELAMVGMGVQTVALSRPATGQKRCD